MTSPTDLEQLVHPEYNGRVLVWPTFFGIWLWQLAYDCPTGTYGRSLPKSRRGASRTMTGAITSAKIAADRLGMPMAKWQ
jgi:hypothetical protein